MTAEEQQSRAVLKTLTGRPWTRLGTVALAAHVFYELAAGVGMPFASRLGAGPAAAVWGSGSVLVFRQAGRQDSSDDTAFAVLNGMFLTAVLAHFTGWPRRKAGAVPMLLECEGMDVNLMPGYNAILYVSGAAAVGGLLENGRGRMLGAVVPALAAHWLVGVQHREFERLRAQARRQPRWWNRRLQHQ